MNTKSVGRRFVNVEELHPGDCVQICGACIVLNVKEIFGNYTRFLIESLYDNGIHTIGYEKGTLIEIYNWVLQHQDVYETF